MDLVFYSDFHVDNEELDRISRIKIVDDPPLYESGENFLQALKDQEPWAIDIIRERLEIEEDHNIVVKDNTIIITHPDQWGPASSIRMVLEEVNIPDMETFGELPLGDPEIFVGEYEEMNLKDLANHAYMVAVSTGARDKSTYIGSTARGPYDFYGMCEAVGTIYKEQQLHAKAIILQTDLHKPLEFLDECTIDFIEARYMDIVADGLLGGAFDDNKEYTCRAGVVEHSDAKDEESAE